MGTSSQRGEATGSARDRIVLSPWETEGQIPTRCCKHSDVQPWLYAIDSKRRLVGSNNSDKATRMDTNRSDVEATRQNNYSL